MEFAYNNSYQFIIGTDPFEALYGRPCRSPACWLEVGDKKLLGLEVIQDTSTMIEIDWKPHSGSSGSAEELC